MKNCSNPKCSQVNPQSLGEFNKHKLTKDKLHSWCKSCKRSDTARYRNANPEKTLESSRNWQKSNSKRTKANKLRYNYWPNLSREQAQLEYDKLFISQKGCCDVCKRHQCLFQKALCVDHNHITGKVRGLLCEGCNKAEGLLGDIRIVENLLNYLKQYD